MGRYDMVQVENSLAHVRVSKDLWMLRSLMGLGQAGWGGVGGKDILFEIIEMIFLGATGENGTYI